MDGDLVAAALCLVSAAGAVLLAIGFVCGRYAERSRWWEAGDAGEPVDAYGRRFRVVPTDRPDRRPAFDPFRPGGGVPPEARPAV